MDNDNDKGGNNYSLQEVLSIASNMLGIKPQDLVTLTEDNDLSDFDSINSSLKTIAIERKNKLIDSEFKRGFKKSAKQTEKLFRETFVNEDLTNMQQDDIVMHLRAKLASTSDNSKKITFNQAMQNDGVKELINSLKSKESNYDNLEKEFKNYKNLQYLKKNALNALESKGANFSNNPTIRARQIATLESELMKINYKIGEDSKPIILDEDGENQKYNKNTADYWDFDNYILTLSPVDFTTEQEVKPNKNIHVPSTKNNNNSVNFGYSKSQISNFSQEDYDRANKQGLTQEADYILEQMVQNAENQQNS